MSYSDSFPSVSPSWQCNFSANGGRLDPRISYSRSTTGTYFGTEKVLSSENLLLQSQDFDTTWSKDASLNAPTGSQTAPDGTSTAWLLTTAASGTGTPFLFQNPSGAVPSNTVCTYVMHLKAGTASHAYISFRGQYWYDAWALIDFASPTSPTTGGSLGSISATSVALGNSWYRVALTFNTGTVSSGYPYVYVGASDGTSPDDSGRVSYTYSGETLYAWGAQLSSTQTKVYDSPTTTQIAREYQTKLQTAAINAPRFEHSASDSASEGLLIEGQSTNLVTYSETLPSGWTAGRSTLTAASGVAPDGTLTSNLWTVDGTASNSHNAYFEWTTGGATPQTASIYAKAGNVNYLVMRYSSVNGAHADGYVSFNLSNGTVGTTTGTITSSSMESCGNGWYRCSVTSTALTNATGRLVIYIAQADNTLNFDGNSYDHIQVWGAQIEANQSHPSSYIKSNSGSATTRAADSAAMVSSSLFDTGSGAIICELGPVAGTVYPTAFALTDSSTQNIVRCQGNNGATQMSLVVNADNSGVATITQSFTSTGTKLGVSYDTNSFRFCTDGGTVDSDTAGQVPEGLNRLEIGGDTYSSSSLNGNVKRIAVYSALTDTNLQALTS